MAGTGVQVFGDGATAGASFGRTTTEKISFYGVTTIVQPAPAVTVGTDIATVILELADLRLALKNLGLIAA